MTMYNFWNLVLEKIAGRGLSDKFHVATRWRNRQRYCKPAENRKTRPIEPARGAAQQIHKTQPAIVERTFPTTARSGNVSRTRRVQFAVPYDSRSGKVRSIYKKPRGQLAKPVVVETRALATGETVSPFKRWNLTTRKGYPIVPAGFRCSCKDTDTPRVRQFITENIGFLYPCVKRSIEELPGFPGWNELHKALEDEYVHTHAHYIWQARKSVEAWIASGCKSSPPSFAGQISVGPRCSVTFEISPPTSAGSSSLMTSLEEQARSSPKTSVEEQVAIEQPDPAQANGKKEEDEESGDDDECAIESCSPSELPLFKRAALVRRPSIRERCIPVPAPVVAAQNGDKQEDEGSYTVDECAVESCSPSEFFFSKRLAELPFLPLQPEVWIRDIPAPGTAAGDEDAISSYSRIELRTGIDPETGSLMGFAEAVAPPTTRDDTLVTLHHRSDSNDSFTAIPKPDPRESIDNFGPWGKYYARCKQEDELRRQRVDVDALAEMQERWPKVPIYANPPLGQLEHLQEEDFPPLPEPPSPKEPEIRFPVVENSYLSLG